MPHSNYTVNGEVWPSATDLTHLLPQDWVLAWYKKEVKAHGWRGWQKCLATSNRGKRMGTHVHGLVERGITGKPYTPYLDEKNKILEPARRLKQLEAWSKALLDTFNKDTPYTIEAKVINKELKIHGTLDAVVTDDELGMKIVDWKTSGSIDPSFGVQLAIYAMCWNDQNPDKIVNVGEIQRIDKKSAKNHVQVKLFPDLQKYYPVVHALRTIWDFVNKQGPWKPEEKKNEG
jgi:hypothetical protein